jgi:hypothetical protein
MNMSMNKLSSLVSQMTPISLEEMKSVRLMKRTDMKFVTNIRRLEQLLERTRTEYYAQCKNDSYIAEYRTVYWDTPVTHQMFRDHHCGHFPRTKVRARTYLDSGHSFLEIKKKDNHGKTRKKRIPVPTIEEVIHNHYGNDFLSEHTPYTFNDIIPTMENRFKRITLVNQAKTERLTIDFDIKFINHETGETGEIADIVIIELKRDGRIHSPILAMLRDLRIKPSGFSKYCIGSAITNKGLKQNRFKKRLHRYDKIAKANATIEKSQFTNL